MDPISIGNVTTFVMAQWYLFLALIVIVALLIRSYRMPALVPPLNVQQAIQEINKRDALMLDVRANEEYQQGHIQNSIHIPLAVLQSRSKELEAYKNHPVIIYCRAGNRSTHAGVILKKIGFSDIKQLKGGILDWQTANLPLTKKAGKPPEPKAVESQAQTPAQNTPAQAEPSDDKLPETAHTESEQKSSEQSDSGQANKPEQAG